MKIKKILIGCFAISAIVSCAIALSSCSSTRDVNGNDHTLIKVEEVAATCTQDGIKEYYKCNGCDLIFEDAEGNILIKAPETIPAGHKSEIVLGVEPTCTQNGSTASKICSLCKEVFIPAKEIPASHNEKATANIKGYSLEVENNKVYVVAYGDGASNVCLDCNEPLPIKIASDFQHNNNIDKKGWAVVKVFADNNNLSANVSESTIEEPAVTPTVFDDGTFEARFDVTDFEAGWTLTIHSGVDGNMQDMKSQGNGDGVAVYHNGKKFSYIKNSDTTWNIISLVVTEAPQNEFNLKGRMSLEESEGVPYVVYNGSWNTQNGDAASVKSKIESEYFSIQQYLNGWATTVVEPIVEVNDDGTVKVKLSLQSFASGGESNPYYMHYGTTSSTQQNIKLHVSIVNCEITVGNFTYKIVKGCQLDTTWTTTLTVIYITETVAA